MGNIIYAIKTSDEGIIIRRTEYDGKVWWVPENPENSHYREYLEWLAEGNTPEDVTTNETE